MLRLVSLIASATEIVSALELTPFQVGRSHECDYPPQIRTLPVCTRPAFNVDGSSADIDHRVKERVASALSVYEVFTDVLEALRPTHVLTQTQCEVCAVTLNDVRRALATNVGSTPELVPLSPNCLRDVWVDVQRVAIACGVEHRGRTVVQQLQTRMGEIARRAERANARPRIACIEWQEPLMAAGNWMPEIIALANGEDLFGKAGAHSPWMQWQELVAADPDVILVAPCGYDLDRTRSEMYWLTRRPEWPTLRAVRDNRVYIADGNQFLHRPGPRLVESLQIVAEVLHPGLFSPLLRGQAWEQWHGTLEVDAARSTLH